MKVELLPPPPDDRSKVTSVARPAVPGDEDSLYLVGECRVKVLGSKGEEEGSLVVALLLPYCLLGVLERAAAVRR